MFDAKIQQIVDKFGDKVTEKTDDIKKELYSMTDKMHEDILCAVGFFGLVAVVDTALLVGILYTTGRKK